MQSQTARTSNPVTSALFELIPVYAIAGIWVLDQWYDRVGSFEPTAELTYSIMLFATLGLGFATLMSGAGWINAGRTHVALAVLGMRLTVVLVVLFYAGWAFRNFGCGGDDCVVIPGYQLVEPLLIVYMVIPAFSASAVAIVGARDRRAYP